MSFGVQDWAERGTCMYWASKVRHSAVMADGDSPTELSRASDISGG